MERLSGKYRDFFNAARRFIAKDRLITDPLRCFAYGTDASFYRLVPKIVVRARTVEEMQSLIEVANRLNVPLTFRAAGTSLSGQAISDCVLVVLSGGFSHLRILDRGEKIELQPGVVGADANRALAQYGRKIGPDPASIQSCMIGGIVANNASGMCCGTSQNSYATIEALKLIFSDGTALDTSDPESRRAFTESHPEWLKGIVDLRDEIFEDTELSELIRRKYRIKNTTGYGLNSFLDFNDPIDILTHLMVGSEGTLGFIAQATYRTVPEYAYHASALALFPDIRSACLATVALKTDAKVGSVELMDRASLASVQDKPGLPEVLKTLGPDASALLVEVRAEDEEQLGREIGIAEAVLARSLTLTPARFSCDRAECDTFWNIRRGLFPAIGANRVIGTTVVIEDVAFPVERMADGVVDLQALMSKHGYAGIIFGHALDGNFHFVFTQGFETQAEVNRYSAFMDEVCELVARKYQGSLKGEHGTGRNMAPFVEMEWGLKAYSVMRRLKSLLDPKGILNPGVILTENPKVHLQNLKALPRTDDLIDRCTECGFCEVKCPSREITTTPR